MTGKELRIVFMGTPDFAVASLKALVEGGYNVVGVITAPDKPAGRGLRIQESAVKAYAVEAGLNILQPVSLKDGAFVDSFRALDADLAVVVAFRMLPEVIWAMPRLGTFNLHASLLPQYRGAAPINWAVINGESRTGVTTFFLNHRIDEGEIIDSREVDITPEDNAGTLHDKLMAAGSELVLETVDRIASGNVQTIKQDNIPADKLKPAPKIFKDTCRIDFSLSGAEIINLIRGLSPYPAAWALLTSPEALGNGQEELPVKIFKASFEPADVSGETPGTIISDFRSYIKVVCADGLVMLEEFQPSGKRRMGAKEFLNGFRNVADSRFK